MPVIAGIPALPDFMALDTRDCRRLGKVMTQKKEAASAVFKAGVFPLEPVTVASLGRFGGFLVRLTVMPKWILDQGNRDLPFFRHCARSSEFPVPIF